MIFDPLQGHVIHYDRQAQLQSAKISMQLTIPSKIVMIIGSFIFIFFCYSPVPKKKNLILGSGEIAFG